MFSVIIMVCSLKSMCVPSFIAIGYCVSEFHGHICPHRNVCGDGFIGKHASFLAGWSTPDCAIHICDMVHNYPRRACAARVQ